MTKLRTHASLVFCAAMLHACGPNYHIARGEEHLFGSRPDAAAQEFQKALDKDPTALAALRGMAAAHIGRDQPVRAIIPAQRAARAGDTEGRRLLSQALLTTGRADDALKAISVGREDAPDDPTFRMLWVRGLTAAGQYDDAAVAADELLIDLSSPEARSLHAWTLSRAGKVDAAVAMAADAVAIAADEAMIQAEAAAIFWKGRRKDDFEQANKMARALFRPHRDKKCIGRSGTLSRATQRPPSGVSKPSEARTPKTVYLPLDSVSSTQNAAPGRMPPGTSALL